MSKYQERIEIRSQTTIAGQANIDLCLGESVDLPMHVEPFQITLYADSLHEIEESQAVATVHAIFAKARTTAHRIKNSVYY